MKYLDASIPLAIILAQPKEKLSDIRKIMLAIESGRENVVTSVFTIAEIIYVLEREGVNQKTIEILVKDFVGCSGLRIVDANSGHIMSDALEIYRKYKIDFIDSHHIATMNHLGIKEIYALDPHYDRVKEIIRLEKLKC